MATLREVHFLSFSLLGRVDWISVDLGIAFHNVAFAMGISVGLEMVFHNVAFVVGIPAVFGTVFHTVALSIAL